MRIVLKPMGLILVLVAFGILTWIATHPIKKDKEGNTVAVNPTIPTVATSPSDSILQNPGFEADFRPVQPYDTKAHLSGSVAFGWNDDSSWAPVTVDYAPDAQNFHSGNHSQKVNVVAIAQDAEARVQFIQSLKLQDGKRYRASCWLRADHPTEIDVALRQKLWPYQYYGVHKVRIDTSWQSFDVTGTPTKGGETLLMLKISKPITFWVDDAQIVAE